MNSPRRPVRYHRGACQMAARAGNPPQRWVCPRCRAVTLHPPRLVSAGACRACAGRGEHVLLARET